MRSGSLTIIAATCFFGAAGCDGLHGFGPVPPLNHELRNPGEIQEGAAEGELLAEARMVLECLETGSYADAREQINELSARFPGNQMAVLLELLLRRELLRYAESTPRDTATSDRDRDAAVRELARAHALLRERRDEDARSALERARYLDLENAEITDSLVTLLKRMGLESYAEGNSTQAILYWQRILEVRPGEAETVRFLHRANAASKKP